MTLIMQFKIRHYTRHHTPTPSINTKDKQKSIRLFILFILVANKISKILMALNIHQILAKMPINMIIFRWVNHNINFNFKIKSKIEASRFKFLIITISKEILIFKNKIWQAKTKILEITWSIKIREIILIMVGHTHYKITIKLIKICKIKIFTFKIKIKTIYSKGSIFWIIKTSNFKGIIIKINQAIAIMQEWMITKEYIKINKLTIKEAWIITKLFKLDRFSNLIQTIKMSIIEFIKCNLLMTWNRTATLLNLSIMKMVKIIVQARLLSYSRLYRINKWIHCHLRISFS